MQLESIITTFDDQSESSIPKRAYIYKKIWMWSVSVFECVTVRQNIMDAGLSQGVSAGLGDTIALFIACPDRGHWPSSHLCHLAAFMQDTGKRAERKWGMERWRKGELEEEKERDGWGRLPEGWSISVIGVIREISHITGWWFRQFRMGRTNAGIQACQMLKHSKFAAPLAVCTYNSTEMDAWWITGEFYPLGSFKKLSDPVLSKCINLVNHQFSIFNFFSHSQALYHPVEHAGAYANTTAWFQFRSTVHTRT